MKRFLLFTTTLLILPFLSHGQSYRQYFDGADTAVYNSLLITFDSLSPNTWQIGTPQKVIFDSASTKPFAIITDTLNPYPSNDTSRFYFSVPSEWPAGIFALQWKQKLDLQDGVDFGLVEFKLHKDSLWQNAFNNPYIYNYYGYEPKNVDTLLNGELGFSGTDSTWKDIWLCLDISFTSLITDTLYFRYSIISDPVQSNHEGWVIDNLLAHLTFIHTVQEKEQKDYIHLFPNPSNGIVNIQVQKKTNKFHVIEEIKVINEVGETVKSFGLSPTKFRVDLSNQPNGVYFITIKTNFQTETHKIIIQH